MTSLASSELALLRGRLEDERQDIENRLRHNDHYGKADSLRDHTGELSSIDNHPADAATELYEREKDISLLEQEELHLRRIEAALAAMDKGGYGVCATCGEPIPFERLKAAPDSLYCIRHAPRDDMSFRRPVEEQFMQPPFGRTSLDERAYGEFDGEDAWQIVESWGNSDSPAMSENRDVTDYNHVGIEAGEHDGYAESIESFLATDITGKHVTVVRNREYDRYMHSGEGDRGLEYEELDE